MLHLLYTIEHHYYVVMLVCVGVALRCKASYKGITTMAKHKKVEGQVEGAGIVASTTSAIATTVVTVAKVLLAVGGMKPPATMYIGGVEYKVPFHTARAVSKRALARALFDMVSAQYGYTNDQSKAIAARLFVVLGGLWVPDNTPSGGHIAIGECRGSKGAVGYIKPNGAWWGTAANVAKASVLPNEYPILAASINAMCGEGDYSKAVVKLEAAYNTYKHTYDAWCIDSEGNHCSLD